MRDLINAVTGLRIDFNSSRIIFTLDQHILVNSAK